VQGSRHKNFQGGQQKKDQKIAKRPKIALLSLFQGGGQEATEKTPKIAKKKQKIAKNTEK